VEAGSEEGWLEPSPLLCLQHSLNLALGLRSGFVRVEALPEKVYEEEDAGKEPGGASMLKVNCICLVVPGRAFWEASQEHSHLTAR
jgi:hypothetical protein